MVYREVLARRRKLLRAGHPYLAASLSNLGNVLAQEGKLTEAGSFHREALAMRRRIVNNELPGHEHRDVAESLRNLAITLQLQGRFAEAEPVARECLALCEAARPGSWQTFSVQCLLGVVLLDAGKYGEAEKLLLAGWEGMKEKTGNTSLERRPCSAQAIRGIVRLYEATERPQKASEWRAALKELESGEGETNATLPLKPGVR